MAYEAKPTFLGAQVGFAFAGARLDINSNLQLTPELPGESRLGPLPQG